MKKFTIFNLALILFLIVHYPLDIAPSFASRFIGNNCSAQWYQINLPVSGQVHRMQFINQNTGWLRMTNGYFLKTTNSGVNWQVLSDTSNHIYYYQFINDSIGYATGINYLTPELSKTTNGGNNWVPIFYPNPYAFGSLYFVNSDTGWVDALLDGLPQQVCMFRTTNGCQTFELIYNRVDGFGGADSRLTFINQKSNGQYYGYHHIAGNLWRTTNSGYNWQQVNFSEAGNVNSFSFLNKDTGWVVYNPNIGNNTKILFTSNTGQNWSQQYYYNFNYSLGLIQAVNKDKIWCGVADNYILVSTNSGATWGKQTSPVLYPSGIYMIDTSLGFAWNSLFYQVIRTTNGGGPITSIEKTNSIVSSKYLLKQNFPNPFNSSTNIEFQIPKSSLVNIYLYDILGREVLKIIENKDISLGNYKVNLDLYKTQLSSGIYIYKMTAFEKAGGNIFQDAKKMIYNK